eukprot:m.52053 g.52053  ORF g.52053 m.52053 type:complete len:94 (+) comp34172_c0_seq3:135-416(+)
MADFNCILGNYIQQRDRLETDRCICAYLSTQMLPMVPNMLKQDSTHPTANILCTLGHMDISTKAMHQTTQKLFIGTSRTDKRRPDYCWFTSSV